MTNYAKITGKELGTKKNQRTPQNQPIPGRETEMTLNRAGGYVFTAQPEDQIRRFLVLGSPATYYASEQQMTLDNAKAVVAFAKSNGVRLVSLIEEVNTVVENEEGVLKPAAAPRKSPSLFALAIAKLFGDEGTRQAVHICIRRRNVVSTLSQMFEFLNDIYVLNSAGDGKLSGDIPMGNGFKAALCDWMIGTGRKGGDRWLSMQFAKYRNRQFHLSDRIGDGSHDDGESDARKSHNLNARDLLRLTHVKPQNAVQNVLFTWAANYGKDASKALSP